MPLVSGKRTGVLGEYLSEMFERLEERISLPAHGRWMFAEQTTSHWIEPVPAPPDDAVNRLQRKRQAQRFGGGLDRRAPEQLAQQRPQQRGIEGVAGQNAREKQREGFAAAPALPAIGTERPLAPDNLAVHHCRVVTPQHAVAVQRAPAAAVRTAPLLERKSTALNSSSSRMNSPGVVAIVPSSCSKAPATGEVFLTALPIHGTRFSRDPI